MSLITTGLISLDQPIGADPRSVITTLARRIADAGRATAAEGLFDDAWAREQKTATGVPGGVAIPHCRSESVTEPTLGFARLPEGVDFGAKDGPADLVFFIAAPAGADQAHLTVLSALARSLVKAEFRDLLRSARTPEEIVAAVEHALAPPEAKTAPPTAEPAAAATSSANAGDAAATSATGAPRTRIVAVTACPTGIAHTYMAADSLTQTAEELGVDLQVEPQGSAGTMPLPEGVIRDADAVIFAVDVDVRDRSRFAGKPVVSGPVKRAIDEPKTMIEQAVAASTDPQAKRVSGQAGADQGSSAAEGFGAKAKRVLLTGVSYMIPFVAAGGLLIALGFLLGGYRIGDFADDIVLGNSLVNLPSGEVLEGAALNSPLLAYLGAIASKIGGLSMFFLVPALAGFIAYAMADRPGLAPGFTVGSVAAFMGAGFLGGIVGGVLAGAVAWWLGSLNVPRWLRGLMPVVIIPLLGSIVASGAMFVVLGGPIARLTEALNSWLSGMTGTSAVLLGVILGLMMCFDLGGPVNKVAYSFAVAGLGAGVMGQNEGPFLIMAAVMASGMVPPLAMAAATLVDRKLFSAAEQQNGKTAILLGAAFISEGAIPFAAADPLRVIPASMAGGAVTGALTMALGVTSQAPHGGIFVFFAIGNILGFVLAILAGTIVSTVLVIALKRWARRTPVPATAEAVAA